MSGGSTQASPNLIFRFSSFPALVIAHCDLKISHDLNRLIFNLLLQSMNHIETHHMFFLFH